MIVDIQVERTYRTRSGETCKVVGIIADEVLFISVSESSLIVEEMPMKLFADCVVEEIN